MKRSALAGLFITAAMLASPVFAAGDKDLCEINLNKINDGKATLATDSTGKSGEIDTAVASAKAAHAAARKSHPLQPGSDGRAPAPTDPAKKPNPGAPAQSSA